MTAPASLTRPGIFAVDPGPELSAWVEYNPGPRMIWTMGITANEDVRAILRSSPAGLLAIEMVASYGMAVGREVFETVLWTGRFIEAWQPNPHRKVYRRDVKLHLCGSARAKDANVRQALLDAFGGKELAVGKKRTPGPLYGVRSHIWSALAVAVTAAETDAVTGEHGDAP